MTTVTDATEERHVFRVAWLDPEDRSPRFVGPSHASKGTPPVLPPGCIGPPPGGGLRRALASHVTASVVLPSGVGTTDGVRESRTSTVALEGVAKADEVQGAGGAVVGARA